MRTVSIPAITHAISVKARRSIDETAAAAEVIPETESDVMLFVNKGTNTATPKGAARSLNNPYVPVPEPAYFAATPERTTLRNTAAFPPNPNPSSPRERPGRITEDVSVKNSK